jgi:hypothetical protein
MSSVLNANAPAFYPSSVRNVKTRYDKNLTEFKQYQDKHYKEEAHIFQDKIYRQFIKEIESGKLNKIDEIQFISSVIKTEVIVHDKNRWYA